MTRKHTHHTGIESEGTPSTLWPLPTRGGKCLADRGAGTGGKLAAGAYGRGAGKRGSDLAGGACKVNAPSGSQRAKSALSQIVHQSVDQAKCRDVQERNSRAVGERHKGEVTWQGPIRMRVIPGGLRH